MQDHDPASSRVRSLLSVGRTADALAAADEAARLGPEQEWPHRLRSQALEEFGRHQQAIAAAEAALIVAPRSPAANARLAAALLADPAPTQGQERSTRALAAAGEAVRLDPDRAYAHLLLARAHGRRGDRAAMEIAAARARVLGPDDAGLHNDAGLERLRFGDITGAGECFARAADLDPRGPATRNYALVCHTLFYRRLRRGLVVLWVARIAARAAAGADDHTRVRLSTGAALLIIAIAVLLPAAGLARRTAPRYRRSLLRAVRGAPRLVVQSLALTTAALLYLGSLPLPTAPATDTAFAAAAAYALAAALACVRPSPAEPSEPRAPTG